MLKHFITLMRGSAHDAAQGTLDRNALRLLEQQIRDGRAHVAAAKRSVALAMAQSAREKGALEATAAKIADLEARARAALEKGEEALAREAAETIAALEDERAASRQAHEAFEREVVRLKRLLRRAEARLRDLERGLRVAAAKDKAQKLGDSGGFIAPNADSLARATLGEAEETLTRLQSRQAEFEKASEALDALDAETSPEDIAARLSDAGCGPPLKTSADDVLARLKAESARGDAARGSDGDGGS